MKKKSCVILLIELVSLFKNDYTNSDISIPRNFIRQKVLKPWELKVPSLIKGIYKSTHVD